MSNYIEQASQLHINLADVAEWVGLHYGRNFECEPFEKRSEWVERYAEGHEILKPAASREVVQREITVHNFRGTPPGEVYDQTQIDDSIKDGDVLNLGSGNVAILMKAWPMVIFGEIEHFHRLSSGVTFESVDDGKYAASAAKAREVLNFTPDPAALADMAFADYNFGEGVVVTDSSGWEYTTPGHERTRKVYVETEREDDGPAPCCALVFTVRFDPATGSLSEACALDDKGQKWGSMPTQPDAPRDICALTIEHFASEQGSNGEFVTAARDVVPPNERAMDRGLFLRTKALALLQDAQALDGLKPFTVTHTHSHGESTYLLWSVERPSQDDAQAVLDSEFEPDREETIVVEDNFTLEEMTGVAQTARLKDILDHGQ